MYDVIVVGARVAGAATALLFARRGLRVLAVDRATFPSDTLSTHQIQVPGVARLARWGLLDDLLAAGTPPLRTVRFDMGLGSVTANLPAYDSVQLQVAPRRTVLDAALVDAARSSGAEVRESFIVEEVLVDDGRVVGIRGREKGGAAVEERAPLVVGADGKHSLVARTAEAEVYWEVPVLSMQYYSYWADLPTDRSEAGGFFTNGRSVGFVPTNDGLTMTSVVWPVARFEEFRDDVEGNFLDTLDAVGIGEVVRAGRRVERFRGSPDLPNFFRKPYGPGWALVGDAGLVMDPLTGQGIGDAFRDAELLVDAVLAGLGGEADPEKALAGYQESRDVAAKPIYDLTTQMARLEPPTPQEQALFAALSRSPEDADKFVSVINGVLPLAEFMTPENMARLANLAAAPS